MTPTPRSRAHDFFNVTPATRRAARHAGCVLLGYGLFFTAFFAPALLSGRVLAPGDGISYFLPAYYAPAWFWDPHVWGGFPAVADAPRMLWYPPALLVGLLPRSWDAFIIAAYVLASGFTYGYVFALTRSRLGATVAGLSYGLCGFMIAHMGHAAVVHTVAWLPLVVWALARMGAGAHVGGGWLAAGALAVGCAALAGHPQMLAYVLVLGGAYALGTGWRAPAGRARYYAACALLFALGTGLAALQLVPTAELAALGLRASLSFADFVAYQLPLRQLPMLLFPFVYGGAPDSPYAVPYFGAWPSSADGWGAGELTGYAGLLPLALACTGLFGAGRRRLVWFWAGVAVIAVLLAVGEATPLARLAYRLPVVNKFRAPARYLFAYAFAVSVLAGLGVSALQRRAVSIHLLRRTLAAAALTLAACLLAMSLFAAKYDELALQFLGRTVSVNPLRNLALAVPLLVAAAAGGALVYFYRRPEARPRAALLVAVLLVDLASVAWFYEWRYRSPYAAYLAPPAAAEPYRAQLAAAHQRLLPVRGGTGRVAELPPNLSQLWRLPSASGYGPFILARTSRLLTMPPHGSVDESWQDPANQGLDLLAVRYVLVPPEDSEPPATTDERGLRWSTAQFNHTIGPGCGATLPAAAQVELPRAARATRLGLVGALACSAELADGAEFAEVVVTDTAGAVETYALRAGRDFSEWAYDCADVRPHMRHARAQVFRDYTARRGETECSAHDYVTFVPLKGARNVRSVALRWIGPAATFVLKRLTAIDDEGRVSTPVHPPSAPPEDGTRWRAAGRIDAGNSGYGAGVPADSVGAARVYENARARPRAWLAAEVLQVSADEAFAAARSSRLPDGRVFEPGRTALVEEAVPFASTAAADATPAGRAGVRLLTADVMEVETDAPAPAFLVTSDTYYPGWTATVDGAPARVYQTDYVLRGVAVPAGSHVVRFEFRPRSFYYGAALSALSLLLLGGCAYWLRRRAAARPAE